MLKMYYFGDIGEYNTESPEYALEKHGALEYLSQLAQQHVLPQHISDETIKLLINTGLLRDDNGMRTLPFPFFLSDDVALINNLMEEPVRELATQISNERDWLYQKISSLSMPFDNEHLLYHLLCDEVFDGTAFEWLASQMCTEKVQPSGRCYLPVAFDDSPELEHMSDNILCSSHNLVVNDMVWNSFGDGGRIRHDMYRMVRVVSKNPDKLNSFVGTGHEWFLEDIMSSVACLSDFFIKVAINKERFASEMDKKMASLLCRLGYLDEKNNPIVPVFSAHARSITEEISNRIMPLAEKYYKNVLLSLRSSKNQLSAIKHNVSEYELGNELWHQLFGRVNEQLALHGLVSAPISKEGEGRYLKSIKLKR